MKTTIRYPLNKGVMIAMLIFALLEILGAATTNHATGRIVFVSLIVFNLLVIAAAVTRSVFSPKQLRLENNAIVIDNKPFHASDISRILIERHRLVGVKPKNKRIVPLSLCFVFEPSSSDGLLALMTWANRNDIDVEHGVFRKWM